MSVALLVLQVVLSIGIIALVLLQKGEGASAGAAFGGGGGAGSVFGASGSSNFLSKSTAVLATIFFLNSIALAYFAAHRNVTGENVLDRLVAPITRIVTPKAAPNTLPATKTARPDDIPPAAKESPGHRVTSAKKAVATTTTDANVPPPVAPLTDGAVKKKK